MTMTWMAMRLDWKRYALCLGNVERWWAGVSRCCCVDAPDSNFAQRKCCRAWFTYFSWCFVLQQILRRKLEITRGLLDKLVTFREHLRLEEEVSSRAPPAAAPRKGK